MIGQKENRFYSRDKPSNEILFKKIEKQMIL